MTDRDNRVVLITGASSGIGAALARGLILAGMRVAVVGRRGERLDALRDKLGVGPDRFLPLMTDLTDAGAAANVVSCVQEWAGRLDVLVNNAGLSLGLPLTEANAEAVHNTFAINVATVVELTRTALPLLIQARGDIVNVGSIVARAPSTGSALYSASKAAITAFSDALRKELAGTGMRVMLIHPGFVKTEFFSRNADSKKQEEMRSFLEKQSFLEADDVAEAIIFAVSRHSNVSIDEIIITAGN